MLGLFSEWHFQQCGFHFGTGSVAVSLLTKSPRLLAFHSLPPHPTFLFLLDSGCFEAAFLLESLQAASFIEVLLRSSVFGVYSVCQILRWSSLSGLSVLHASEGALLAGTEAPKESLLFTLDQDWHMVEGEAA